MRLPHSLFSLLFGKDLEMSKAIHTQSAAAPKVGGGTGKRIVALIIMIIGIVALLLVASYIMNRREELVPVMRLKSPLTAGTAITDSVLEEYQMPKSTYDTLGSITLKDSKGNPYKKQVYLLWSQKKDVIGMFASNYIAQGDILTANDLTKELTVRNPWVSAMKEDEEIFTMSFDASSVNTRMLYPGTRLRARLVSEVPVDVSAEIKNKIAAAENIGDSTDSIVHDAVVTVNGNIIEGAEAKTSVQVAEVVIDDIIITDMTNSSGESIYDLYMSLLKLPINKRVNYLRTTTGKNKTANSWADRVTPKTITFILDKESASRLAEFEKTGGSIKYTILPDNNDTEDQANLMSQFVELSNQINTVAED